jgi:hypothetical protein
VLGPDRRARRIEVAVLEQVVENADIGHVRG